MSADWQRILTDLDPTTTITWVAPTLIHWMVPGGKVRLMIGGAREQ